MTDTGKIPKEIRNELIIVRERFEDLGEGGDFDVSHLIIEREFNVVEGHIERAMDAFEREGREDIESFIPELSLPNISTIRAQQSSLTTPLQCYNNFKHTNKVTIRQKNVLHFPHIHSTPVDSLPSDTLLIQIAFYHPVEGYKA